MLSKMRQDYKPNDEIYTPPLIFQALKLEFDLDVCAPEGGLPWIPAKKHYSIVDDGLVQTWNGLVWCNPPYSKPKPWIEKFIEHGNGIILVSISRSQAAKALWNNADAIVINFAKYGFVGKDLEPKQIFMPVWFAAMGDEASKALNNLEIAKVR